VTVTVTVTVGVRNHGLWRMNEKQEDGLKVRQGLEVTFGRELKGEQDTDR
jgi:hypothetical protein